MRLFAKVSDPDLLLRSLNEAGTAFYRPVGGKVVEAVYFSASRTIHFLGELTPRQYESLKGQAYPAERISVDERWGTIMIDQIADEP